MVSEERKTIIKKVPSQNTYLSVKTRYGLLLNHMVVR